jgi:predicted Zn-dependent protease
MNGEFNKALEATDCAPLLMPSSPMLDIRRAHALMLLGKEQEARRLYLHWRKRRIGPEQTSEHVILQGFQALRQPTP